MKLVKWILSLFKKSTTEKITIKGTYQERLEALNNELYYKHK